MNKTIIALAALAAVCGSAAAQTNITIYGVADVGLTRSDTSTTEAVWGLGSGIQSGSRIGFRGTEDLGGGLSAIFTLENGYNIDTGALGQGGRLFGRQAFVGLAGGFGTVRFGRLDTPLHRALDTIDPFGTGLAGDIESVFTANGLYAAGTDIGAENVRMDNTINYATPNFGGFSAQIAYGFGEVAGSTSAGRQLGFSGGYAAGPLTALVGYHDNNNAAGTADGKTAFVGGVYDLKVVKLHAAYANNESETSAGVTTAKSRDAMLGVSAPVGPGTVIASYLRHDNRTGAGADADKWALGYTHALSKRTNLYTSYGRLNRKPAGAVDTSVFNAGIRHRF
ncbi:porin [Noviherbaspirillum aerium]|uniref:porin n=1 Tax=Noviherbaspirillum aerium TaxID=2588497 RepID=UPI00124D76B7|nr:porin [Noviherbaspirillum aerium]